MLLILLILAPLNPLYLEHFTRPLEPSNPFRHRRTRRGAEPFLPSALPTSALDPSTPFHRCTYGMGPTNTSDISERVLSQENGGEREFQTFCFLSQ